MSRDDKTDDFSHQNLSGRALTSEDLANENLTGANLTGATVTDVDFSTVIVDKNTSFKNVILSKEQVDALKKKHANLTDAILEFDWTQIDNQNRNENNTASLEEIKGILHTTGMRVGVKNKEEIKKIPANLLLPHCAFLFDDFSGVDFGGLRFYEEKNALTATSRVEEGVVDTQAAQPAATKARSENSDDGFTDTGYGQAAQQHAVFLKPDFAGAKNLSLKCFIPTDGNADEKTALETLFPNGYRNDGGVLNQVTYEACRKSVAESGGLTESQICAVIEHMNIDVNGATSEHVVDVFDNKGISYSIHEVSQHPVLNIERIFPDKDIFTGPAFINQSRLEKLFQSVLQQQNKIVDCINIPMTLTSWGRKHYVAVSIFKRDYNTIGAYVIDSTGNPLGLDDVEKKVKDMLEKNWDSVKALLGISVVAITPTIHIESIQTGVQPSLISVMPKDTNKPLEKDNRCGVYVMAAMRELTQTVLRDGPSFLTNKQSVKKIVRTAHESVRDGFYLQQHCNNNIVRPAEKTKYQALHEYIDAIIKQRSGKISGSIYAESQFILIVKQTLENYQKSHNMFSRGLFHSEGTGYVTRALAALKDAETADKVNQGTGFAYQLEAAKNITIKILSAGLHVTNAQSKDYTIKKVNDRIKFLVSALKEAGFVFPTKPTKSQQSSQNPSPSSSDSTPHPS